MEKTRPPRRRLRRFLIVLIILTTLIGAALLFGPALILRALNFVPRGSVETYWHEVEQQSITSEPQALPAILSTRLATRVALAPTAVSTEQVSNTPSVTPMPTLARTATVPPTGSPQATALPTNTPTSVSTPIPTPTPTPTNPFADYFSSAFQPQKVHIFSRGYLDLSMNGSQTSANALWIGKDTGNQPLGIIEFDENAIPQLCQLYFNNCRDPRFRIDKVDFRPGGMEVYGSINVVGLFWQQVGVVFLLDANNVTLHLGGMIWNDEIYEVPKSGQIATTLTDLTNRGNAALKGLTIDADNTHMTIAQLYFDDNRFIVVLKDAS